jgi:fatty-acyl-CoA synthase
VLGNGKIDKRPLRRDAWLCDDAVWWRPPRSTAYVQMSDADRDALREQFRAHDRMGSYPVTGGGVAVTDRA